MDITSPVIGTGVLVALIAFFIALKQKAYIRAAIVTAIFLLVSYFGHHRYNGDCGQQIVFLNKTALVLVALWLALEISLLYLNAKKKPT